MLLVRSRSIRCAALLSAVLVFNGCAGAYTVVRRQAADLSAGGTAISWFAPQVARDVAALTQWRESVGPPVLVQASRSTATVDRLLVVNWNAHVGGGDIRELYADLRERYGDMPIVFLLQEAFREGPEVPSASGLSPVCPDSIAALPRTAPREEIEAVASALNLHAYYVPSMRNGAPPSSDEDRGNAILSTLPLTDLSAIELPFERQRRVAVAATVGGTTSAGLPWRVRLVSAHLDTMGGARRLWFAGAEYARLRQARGLADALEREPAVVLGADLNTVFGFADSAYREVVGAFPDTRVTDRRPTFASLLRLDHLFFRLPDGWAAEFYRADESYGSDHYPLIGIISVSGSATLAESSRS